MKKGTLDNGFKYEVDESNLDDMEFLELFAGAMTGENPWGMFKAINKLFPGDAKKHLYDFCRDPKTKKVPPEKVGDLIGKVIEDAREDGKNS